MDPSAEANLQALLDAVQADPSAFDFYALLRRVDVLRPDAPRTGEALRPRQEALRLGQAPELDFAAAPLQALQPQSGAPPRLTVRFFGLLGPQGPMPLHFTEFVRERLRHHDDATLAHFLDLFHHRMLSLFYRAWAQTQPVVQLDRPDHEPRVDPPKVDTKVPPGMITIDSAPVYAVIYIDGKKLGETPLVNVKLAPGKHAVRAVSPSGATKSLTITIEAGKTAPPRKISW